MAEVAGCDSELICEIQQEARDASRGVREGKRIWGGVGPEAIFPFFSSPPAEIRFQTWNLKKKKSDCFRGGGIFGGISF